MFCIFNEVMAKIGKARTTFRIIKNVWSSKGIGKSTKLRIFKTSVKSILLCDLMAKRPLCKLQTYINGCLRWILRRWWILTLQQPDSSWEKSGDSLVVDFPTKLQKTASHFLMGELIRNKQKHFTPLQVNSNTIKGIAGNMKLQLKNRVDSFDFFSVDLDKSRDVHDTTQLLM